MATNMKFFFTVKCRTAPATPGLLNILKCTHRALSAILQPENCCLWGGLYRVFLSGHIRGGHHWKYPHDPLGKGSTGSVSCLAIANFVAGSVECVSTCSDTLLGAINGNSTALPCVCRDRVSANRRWTNYVMNFIEELIFLF